MLECPPVELQQIDLFDAEPVEPLLHPLADNVGGHRTRRGTPFCEGERAFSALRIAGEHTAGDDLGAAVVIGHVERIEACFGISLQRVGAAFGIDRLARFLDVGDLPQAADEPADRQAVCKRDAVRSF